MDSYNVLLLSIGGLYTDYGRARAYKQLKIASTLCGELLKYPIFLDILSCANSVYQLGILSLPPNTRIQA